MRNLRCSRATSILTKHLIAATPLPSDWREHVRSCNECSEILRQAEQLNSLLESSPAITEEDAEIRSQEMIAAAQTTAKATYRRRLIIRAMAVVSLYALVTAAWAHTASLKHPYAVTSMIAFLFIAPFALWFIHMRSTHDGPGRLYKRLSGHQLSGVCRGISTTYGIQLWLVRALFLVLCLVKGLGLAIYLALDIMLPIHPDDRVRMLRFRLVRWWRGKFTVDARAR